LVTVLSNGSLLGKTLGTALMFAFLTTALPWGLIVLCMRQPRASGMQQAETPPKMQFLHALRDCLIALSMVGMGLPPPDYTWAGWMPLAPLNCFTC
jgi:hypothetical protein